MGFFAAVAFAGRYGSSAGPFVTLNITAGHVHERHIALLPPNI